MSSRSWIVTAFRRIGLLMAVLSTVCLFMSGMGYAELEWMPGKGFDLGETPLDLAVSPDGQWVFVLSKGMLTVYSESDGSVIGRTPVDLDFDRISISPRDNRVVLAGGEKGKVRFIDVSEVYSFDLSGLAYKGAKDAEVPIVVFSDYQCPYCAKMGPLLDQVLRKHPKQVKVVYKSFPLGMHQFAKQAAEAALAANKQGKFWEFHDELYKNLRSLSNQKIDEIAKELGLNMDQFHQDMKSEEVRKLILRDMEEGREAKVRGTPTIFVGGRLLKRRSPQGIDQLIQAALKKK